MKQPTKFTDNGKIHLGKILKQARESEKLSMDALIEYLENKTGERLAKSTISHLERGHSAPQWDTLSVISASDLVPYTVHEMLEIASEMSDEAIADYLLIRINRLPKDLKRRLLSKLIESI